MRVRVFFESLTFSLCWVSRSISISNDHCYQRGDIHVFSCRFRVVFSHFRLYLYASILHRITSHREILQAVHESVMRYGVWDVQGVHGQRLVSKTIREKKVSGFISSYNHKLDRDKLHITCRYVENGSSMAGLHRIPDVTVEKEISPPTRSERTRHLTHRNLRSPVTEIKNSTEEEKRIERCIRRFISLNSFQLKCL